MTATAADNDDRDGAICFVLSQAITESFCNSFDSTKIH